VRGWSCYVSSAGPSLSYFSIMVKRELYIRKRELYIRNLVEGDNG
jgi:hypothetical protein